MPYEAVQGIVTHSRRGVMQALGVRDAEKAAVLAALRLEARTGHPPMAGPVIDQRSTFN